MSSLAVENQPSGRMRKSLARLQAIGGVHEDSLAAVMNLVNPFPDYPAKRVGWPDSKGGSSVVLVDLFETSITQPSGLLAGETWDLHAIMLPQVFNGNTGVCTSTPFSRTAPGATSAYPLGVYTAKTGSLPAVLNVEPDVKYTYGDLAQGAPFRVIAQGLELVNTSADLYRGGTAFAYRYEDPVTFIAPYTSQAPSGVLSVASALDATLYPPTFPSDIDDFPNTYVGDGRDGVYVINTPTDPNNEPKIYRGRDVGYFANPNDSGNPTGRAPYGGGAHNGWCMAGGFMTGLAQGSSILLKHRVFLEIFPSPFTLSTSKSLVRLSDKCTPYSPMVMEVLAQVIRDMPAGCAYTENPLGEWFESIMDHVSKLAPVIGKAVGTVIPGAGLVGDGLGLVSGGIAQKMRNKRIQSTPPSASTASARIVKLPHQGAVKKKK